MMKIVPSLLAEDFRTFTELVRKSESFTDYVQFDLMDGKFVATRSFPVQALNQLETSVAFEVHLMIEDPASALRGMKNEKLRQVIFHIESKVDAPKFIHMIKERGLKAGVAVNPETAADLVRLLQTVDSILLLTVDPGRYGSPFKPDVLKKVARIREFNSEVRIGVDGGVSLDNLDQIKDAGVDYACVGSRILLQPDPAASYREFVRRSDS
jgi:ribulose-phosphate 3-epimerase